MCHNAVVVMPGVTSLWLALAAPHSGAFGLAPFLPQLPHGGVKPGVSSRNCPSRGEHHPQPVQPPFCLQPPPFLQPPPACSPLPAAPCWCRGWGCAAPPCAPACRVSQLRGRRGLRGPTAAQHPERRPAEEAVAPSERAGPGRGAEPGSAGLGEPLPRRRGRARGLPQPGPCPGLPGCT